MKKPEYSWEGEINQGYVILENDNVMQPEEIIKFLDWFWDLSEWAEKDVEYRRRAVEAINRMNSAIDDMRAILTTEPVQDEH